MPLRRLYQFIGWTQKFEKNKEEIKNQKGGSGIDKENNFFLFANGFFLSCHQVPGTFMLCAI